MDGAPAPRPAAPPVPEDAPRARAPEAAAHWLRGAVAAIDAEFGPGYAAANPALVAAMVQACALDAAVRAGQEAHAETLETVRALSRETNHTLLKLKPKLFG